MTREQCLREAAILESSAKEALVALILLGETTTYNLIMNEAMRLQAAAEIPSLVERIEYLGRHDLPKAL